MSEETNHPPMKNLNQLLPLDALFIYCAANLGEFTVDKENKTITFNQLYTFDSAMLDEWKSFLESARTEYNDGLAEGQTIADNDEQLFSNCTEMVELAKTLIG